MKCYNCGAELSDDTKFCSYCGVKIEKKTSEPSQPQEPKNYDDVPNENPINEPLRSNTATKSSPGDNIKGKLSGFWNGLDLFCKVATVAIGAVAILLIVSVCAKRGLAIFFSVFQLAGIITALLMHKGTIKLEQKLKWIKYLVLAFAIFFTALNVMSYSWGQASRPSGTPVQNPTDYQTPGVTAEPDVKTTAIAPCSSEDCIGKDYSSVKSDFIAAGFEQIKVEKVEDLQSTDADKVDTVVSVSIGEKTEFTQGQEFPKDNEVVILYHVFSKCSVTIHVDFIPNLIFSKYNVDLLVNGVDKGTLEHGEDKDFNFSLEPGEYTLTFESADSSSVKGEVSLTVDCDVDASYKISCYSDKVSVEELYVDRQTELAEGEVKLDASASDYNHKNYEEVTARLKALGFTNVKFEVLYDIVWGWTDDGEVDSVSIAGNKDFIRGDVFASDVEIIITYHMPQDDDPTKIHPPKSASDFWHMNYEDVVKILEEAGFTNITLKNNTRMPGEGEDGEVESIFINEQSSFSTSSSYDPNAEVVIIYTKLKEIITVDNNSDFASLMGITDQTDAATIRSFTSSHIGDVIEFDGCIAFMMNHKEYKTRFDICMAGGNYNAERVYGPLFAFEDVNYYDMNVTGTDTVAQGMDFRIVAEIKGYSAEGGYILLKPVSLKAR